MTLFIRYTALCALILTASCTGEITNPFQKTPAPGPNVPEAAPQSEDPDFAIGSGGASPDRLDQTSDSQLETASAVGGGASIGDTIASLGDPTMSGLWLRTPLVKSEVPGRLVAQSGKSLAVTLIPIEGETTAGSQISLAAMRGLGLNLTDLPMLQVFRVSGAG
ncbi:MAG: D-galactarate dehydratase [Litoreibacter sp.]